MRYTKAGTILAAHMDWNKVTEYDSTGKKIWEVAVLSPWTALRLPSGNTLVSSNNGFVKEFNPKGDVVWEYDKSDAAAVGIRLFNTQGIARLAQRQHHSLELDGERDQGSEGVARRGAVHRGDA